MRALPLVGGGQRRDAADARIEALGDALDHAAFARGVAALEDHDDLQLLLLHPVLQFHQLALQAQQLLEVNLAVEPVAGVAVVGAILKRLEPVVVELHLDFFVERVLKVGVDQFAHIGAVGRVGHRDPLVWRVALSLSVAPKIPASFDGGMTAGGSHTVIPKSLKGPLGGSIHTPRQHSYKCHFSPIYWPGTGGDLHAAADDRKPEGRSLCDAL